MPRYSVVGRRIVESVSIPGGWVSRIELAHKLQALLKGDPEALRHIQAMADVVDLPTAPLLQTHLLPPELDTLPILVVDLNDDDKQRGLDTLAKFERLGLPRRRTLVDGTPFGLAPSGWSYFLWRWQIVVLAGKHPRSEVQRKLLFTELLPPNDWYDQLAHGETGGMGLLIGNFFEQDISAQAILDHMSAGELLACVVPGATSEGKLR
jgi:hypothetical protein